MNRPEDIKARIGNIDQIEGIVSAMRALAAAHEHEAQRHVAAIREQAATLSRAMASALSLLPDPAAALPDPATTGDAGRHLRIVVGAAQGFSGAYNTQVVAAATDNGSGRPTDDFLIIGVRCIAEFESRGIAPVWAANMAARAADVPGLANRVVDAVFERIAQGRAGRVSIVHGEPSGATTAIRTRWLMPMDFSGIDRPRATETPLTTLAPDVLIARLVEEYVFTGICEALMLGYGAENDARLKAMSRAKTNVTRIGDDLRIRFTQAMQEQTTTEIIELSQSAE